jgi:hypothetical protein
VSLDSVPSTVCVYSMSAKTEFKISIRESYQSKCYAAMTATCVHRQSHPVSFAQASILCIVVSWSADGSQRSKTQKETGMKWQSTSSRTPLFPQHSQMIGIVQTQATTRLLKLLRSQALETGLRSYGHEDGQLNGAMWEVQDRCSCSGSLRKKKRAVRVSQRLLLHPVLYWACCVDGHVFAGAWKCEVDRR